MDSLVFSLANDITRNHMRSALPDAPVVPDRSRPRLRRRAAARRQLARLLLIRRLRTL